MFAAPHGVSQRTTSFIACACQGIHRTPLRHLIALIINARPRQQRSEARDQVIKNPTPNTRSPIPNRRHCVPHLERRGTSAMPSSRRHELARSDANSAGTGLRKTSVTREVSVGRGGQASASSRSSPPLKAGTSGQSFSSRCQQTGIRGQMPEVRKTSDNNPRSNSKSLRQNAPDAGRGLSSVVRPPIAHARRPARLVEPCPFARRDPQIASTNKRQDPAGGTTKWWSQTGSNRRPPACKAGALPTELWPRRGKAATGIRDQKSGGDPLLIPDF